MSWGKDVPNPGSDEALDAGCLCARMDNCRGAGIGCNGEKWGWWITEGCPLHAPVSATATGVPGDQTKRGR